MALGLERAGFEPVLLVDNEPAACSTLRLNRPTWNTLEADIRGVAFDQWQGVDLLTGGLPCPPYSIAGQGKGSDDDRDLFPTMLEIVSVTKPKAVLIENVRGILSARFAHERRVIDGRLASMGYNNYWTLLNAADFGTPQNRWRVFLIALRKEIDTVPEWPAEPLGQRRTVGEAIGDLMGANGWERAGEWTSGAEVVAPTIVGGSKKHGGPDLGPSRARKEWAIIGVDGLGIASEAPSRGFNGMPRLTPEMLARIQGFPDEWRFYGNKTAVCRQIGNALPPQLGEAVAKGLLPCLGG